MVYLTLSRAPSQLCSACLITMCPELNSVLFTSPSFTLGARRKARQSFGRAQACSACRA